MKAAYPLTKKLQLNKNRRVQLELWVGNVINRKEARSEPAG